MCESNPFTDESIVAKSSFGSAVAGLSAIERLTIRFSFRPDTKQNVTY